MLFLISTPIGNLSDISFRAIEVLKDVDAILCEDTRRSSILLKNYSIDKPLYSYHKFNEKKNLDLILARLKNGEKIALISDAGTPCLNDPGLILVKACIEEDLLVTAIPGACSPIMALTLSGFDTSTFQFIGFLPKKPAAALKTAIRYPGTTVALESPERLLHTLETLAKIDPVRKIVVAREMTKKFEECKRGKVTEVLKHFSKKKVKGEICLVIAAGDLPIEDLPLDELITLLQEEHGLSIKEAIKLAATLLKKPKSEIYRQVHSS
jgi:16S rRNA (cytidine1402-2'-O)-methyltransferase